MSIEDALFAVQRGNKLYSCTGGELRNTLEEGDILLTQRGGKAFQWEAEELKTPWEGHDGGIWHIKNVTGENLTLYPSWGPYTAWNIDGTEKGEITEVAVGEELVFVTEPDESSIFSSVLNASTEWEFGDETDTSRVISMNRMFYMCESFNSDISNWDTSNVINMNEMFMQAKKFNQDISGWDVSNVRFMWRMFYMAESFNQPIGNWIVSNVETMGVTFSGAKVFNGDLSGWDTSKVTNMDKMFQDAYEFDSDIGNWDVSKVREMTYMFSQCKKFNQDLSAWCVPSFNRAPRNFDNGANAWTLPRPVWGSCP